MATRGRKCSECSALLELGYLFCPLCGSSVTSNQSMVNAEMPGPSTSRPSTVDVKTKQGQGKVEKFSLENFETYKKKKEKERSSFFVRKGGRKRSRSEEEEVCITIGLMKEMEKIRRGESLPLKIKATATAEEILQAAVKKHTAFNKRFNSKPKYKLVFKDGSEVRTVPGSDPEERFTLKRYKELSGFSFARITLYLLPEVASLRGRIQELKECIRKDPEESESSEFEDSELENSKVQEANRSTKIYINMTNSEDQPRTTVPVTCPLEQMTDMTELHAPNELPVECPICFERFPIGIVAEHADECGTLFQIISEGEISEGEINDETDEITETLDGVTAELGENSSHASQSALKITIQTIGQQQLDSEEEPVRVTVRRLRVWDDFKRARTRYYSTKRKLKITFSGEPAVDDGGPKREFFTEIMTFMQRRFFPDGQPNSSTVMITQNVYKLCGELMAMSIVQGGQAPCMLSPVVYDYLIRDLKIQNTQSSSYKSLCEKLAEDTADFGSILLNEEVFPLLAEIGYQGVPGRETRSSINSLIQSICLKDQLGSILPQLAQLEDGLSTYGLITEIRKAPNMWESVLVVGKGVKVTPTTLIDGIHVIYSESQMKRQKEADTYTYFCDFIHTLAMKEIEGKDVEDLLQWLTGSRKMPPLGLPTRIKCQFLHGCKAGCRCRPTTSTCDLMITLPVHLNNEEEMVEIMTSALADSVGFGLL